MLLKLFENPSMQLFFTSTNSVICREMLGFTIKQLKGIASQSQNHIYSSSKQNLATQKKKIHYSLCQKKKLYFYGLTCSCYFVHFFFFLKCEIEGKLYISFALWPNKKNTHLKKKKKKVSTCSKIMIYH